MQYDPIKKTLGNVVSHRPVLRKVFYRLLDILLLRSWHIHQAIRMFSRSVKKGETIHVLDAGSGFGQYAWYMARKHPQWNITAIDIKEEEIMACNHFFDQTNKKNVRFVVGDLRELPGSECYDLILSVDVMEHIEEDELVFSNFYRLLKSGGLLLISTPSDKGGSDVQNDSDHSFIDEHVRDGYGIGEIENKLSKSGFQHIAAKYSYGAPGSAAWRLSMKVPMTMLGWSRAMFIVLPVYYLLCMPFVLLLNLADLKTKQHTGTGLIVKAWKKRNKIQG